MSAHAKQTRTNTPQIYVACLSAYNAGKLHGRWIDTTIGAEQVWEEIQDLLKTSPEGHAEEFAIHDHQYFGDIQIHEYEDIDRVCALAEAIMEHGEAIVSVATEYVQDASEITEWIEEHYQGTFQSPADWAEEFLSDTGMLEQIPGNLRAYFDFESYARDAELGGDMMFVAGGEGVHAFWT